MAARQELIKKDMASVIIDTTVQIKNIKHWHDAHLLGKAREEIVKLSHSLGLKLNDTYAKHYKSLLIKLSKYRDTSKAKKRDKDYEEDEDVSWKIDQNF